MKYEDIKTPEELFEYMKENIKYGFVSKITGNKYSRKEINNDKLYDELIFKEYFFQSPEELLQNRYGICFDQVEFAKDWLLKNNYEIVTFYSDFHNHTIIIYRDIFDNTCNLFERTFPGHNAIYKKPNIEEILDIYKEMHFQNAKPSVNEINLYRYYDMEYGINIYDFINRAKESKEVITLKRTIK